MWKITTRLIAGHPLSGVGWGNFAGAYGEAQAAYFAQGKGTPQEEYVAGSPEYAFNEFLHIAAETGVTGLLLFLAILVLAFRSAYKKKQTGVIGSLTAFLTFSCFSYPFSIGPFNILFVFLLVLAFLPPRLKLSKANSRKWKIGIAGVLVLLLISGIRISQQEQARQQIIDQWHEEQTYYSMEIYEETVDNYRKLYPQLRDEPKFLFEFGQCLSKTKSYEESNRILLEGARQSSDPMFWNIMGKNYQALQDYAKAENCFIHAYHMVPHRLYPLYLLANLYFDSGQTSKGITTARQVLAKEPKVMSTAIEEMKTEMKEKITSWLPEKE